MKETMREQLERLLMDLNTRIHQLKTQSEEYAKEGKYDLSNNRTIKMDALLPVTTRIEDILKP